MLKQYTGGVEIMTENKKAEIESKLQQIRTWITDNADVICGAGFSLTFNYTRNDKPHVHAVWAGISTDILQILDANNDEFLNEAVNREQLKKAMVHIAGHLKRSYEKYDREKAFSMADEPE